MQPVIGINSNYIEGYYRLDIKYVEAIKKADGSPLILPLFDSIDEIKQSLDKVNGLLFTGGADIDPSHWGEKLHPETMLLNPAKERSDMMLLEQALNRKIPLLAICYGCQLLNVVLGGSLHQHIHDIANVCDAHKCADGKLHTVKIRSGSILAEIVGQDQIVVNSYHHQAINDLADGLNAVAYCEDGLVEAIELPDHGFALGVQWHPERDLKENIDLFMALVTAC